MVDYAKMKNAELEVLLRERNLPTGGKKADMVDRLKKDDEKKADKGEDEIDWDDDEADSSKPAVPESASTEAKATAAKATNEPAATAIKAGGQGQVDNPQAVPNQVAGVDPAKTDDLTVKPPSDQDGGAEAEAKKSEEPPVDFSRGLAASKLEEEIEKRKARAKKFGLNIEEDEGLKKLERAQKFGESGPPKGLDEALPERRKRGRDGEDDGGRNKRRGGRFDGRRGRGNRDGDRRRDNRRDQNRRPKSPEKQGNWMSDADKAKAEARKNRFAAPAAST